MHLGLAMCLTGLGKTSRIRAISYYNAGMRACQAVPAF